MGIDDRSDSDIEGDNLQLDMSHMCFACEKYDEIGQLKECHGGRVFHAPCWAAVRAFQRSIPSDSESKLKYKHRFHHEPARWREELKPFLAGDHASRAQARQLTKTTWGKQRPASR